MKRVLALVVIVVFGTVGVVYGEEKGDKVQQSVEQISESTSESTAVEREQSFGGEKEEVVKESEEVEVEEGSENESEGIEIEGHIEATVRANPEKGEFSKNKVEGYVRFLGEVGDEGEAVIRSDFSYEDRSGDTSPSELESRYGVEPLEIQINEAYVSYPDFLIDGLDLKVGKQRIAWGKADKLNPTDNLNPDDFTDPFDFGKKIPTMAFKVDYALLDDFSVSAVFEPWAVPARLPDGYTDSLKSGLIPYVNFLRAMFSLSPVSDVNVSLDNLKWSLHSSQVAFKFSGTVSGVDFSLSYFRGFDDVPIVKSVNIVSSNVRLGFYRESVVGFDLAKDIGGLLVWAEVGVFFPEKVEMLTTTPMSVITNTALDDTPYVKYTVGFDKNISGGYYINVQWNHGFFTERGIDGQEELQDYLFARFEKKMFDDKLKLAVNGGANFKDLDDAFDSDSFTDFVKDNMGFLYGGEVSYSPNDSLTLSAGGFYIEGEETTTFGLWRDRDMVYIKAEVDF